MTLSIDDVTISSKSAAYDGVINYYEQSDDHTYTSVVVNQWQ